MDIICGSDNDKRTVSIRLPDKKSRIGVLVSGGIDSAILYYLILLENKFRGNTHEVYPISLMRKEGSRYFSSLVVGAVNQQFSIPFTEPRLFGDNTLPEEEQIKSLVDQALAKGFDIVYAGVIEQLPQHMDNWKPIPSKETARFKTPFQSVNKSHVIEMVIKFNQEQLFYITHSCADANYQVGRCYRCNGCNERTWGFEELGLSDPGTI